MKKLLIYIFILTMLTAIAYADSAPSTGDVAEFYGTATSAPAGTVITAKIGGVEVGSITTITANEYGCSGLSCSSLLVTGSTGNTITFTASGGSLSPSTAIFNANKSRLDFTYTATTTSPGSSTGGGSSGGGAATPPATTEVTDSALISEIKGTLPEGWTNVEVQQEGIPSTAIVTLTVAAIDAALADASSAEAKAVLEEIKAAVQAGEVDALTATVTMTTYKVNNKDTGDTVYRTKITITIEALSNMENVEIIEVIPKDVAADVSEIIFTTEPIVLQADPIVQWNIPLIASGQSIDLSYYVSKKLTSINDKTIAVGTKSAVPPAEQPPAVTPGEGEGEGEAEEGKFPVVGIIIILVIVVLGLLIFFMMRKKPKG